MSSTKQQLLGTVAPGRTTAAYRFERETLKRGGPLAVQGKRWTKKPKSPKVRVGVAGYGAGKTMVQANAALMRGLSADAIIRGAAAKMRMR